MKKYLLHSITIGVLLFSLVACAKQKRTGPLLQGRALEKEGDYFAALDHYQGMKNENFRQDNVQNLYYLYGDILEAMQAIESGDASAEQYYELGDAYYNKAKSFPDTAVGQPAGQVDLNNYFARQREQLQGHALESLNTATALDSSHMEALWLQGQMHEERGETDQAILAYQQMLQGSPGTVGVLSKDGAGAATVPEDAEGRQQYAKALARLGLLTYERGAHQDAMDLVKHSLFVDPQNTEGYFGLGELYARQGDSAHAIMQYEAALCTEPAYLEAYYRIARVYLLRSEPIEAERILRLGRVNNPEAIHLALFHNALKNSLDLQEQTKASKIIDRLEGDAVSGDLAQLNVDTQGYQVQLLYYDLRLDLLQRQRPYWLACSSTQEHPYFITQIDRTQAKINSIKEILASAE